MANDSQPQFCTLNDLADEYEREGRIPIGMAGHPDFFFYGHETGSPAIPDRTTPDAQT